MNLEEKYLSSERKFTGKIINLDVEQVKLPNGQTATREIVHHHGAAGIMPFLENKQKMLFVKQWREPMRKLTLEIPAGKIDMDENNPKEVALRELNEETGYKSPDMYKLCGFYSTPGFSDEYMTLFVAPTLEKVIHKRSLDSDEFLNVVPLTLEQAKEQIKSGLICDAKSILAVVQWENMLLKDRLNG